MSAMTLSDAIRAQAAEAGFVLPERGDTPELPPDITVISSASIMQLMQGFTAMIGYAATQEAFAKNQATAAASRYKVERGKRYIILRQDSRYSETERSAELDCDDELVDLKKEEIAAESYAILVKALKSDLEKKYELLSRELTRRGQNQERHFD